MSCRNLSPSTLLRIRRHPILLFLRYLDPKPSTISFHLRRNTYFYSPPNLRRTAQIRSAWNVTAISAAISATLVGTLYFYSYSSPTSGVIDLSQREEDDQVVRGTSAIMAGSSLPGRPGNLTPEQEVKLQEMWTATLKVFGLPVLANGINGEPNGHGPLAQTESRARAGADGLEKKNKKRGGLFGRKNHDEGDDTDTSTVTDADDKYGQTKELHKVLANEPPEKLRQAFWSMVKHDNPDALLLRFLRARKWNVDKALAMLIATMNWRMSEMNVDDDIVRRGEGGAAEDSMSSTAAVKKDGEDFLAQLRLGKSFLHGTDKSGRPMCFVRVRLHKQGEQTESSLERYTVYTIETARHLLQANVDTAAVVFDMTDFSLANMDYGPVKFMIKCFEANYPESLGVVLVHNSPWIFHSIWKIIKGWLDPVVASKVHFTKGVEGLQEFVNRDHIPKELGGDEPWSYHYVEPVPSENILLTDDASRQKLLDERAAVVRDFESTTQAWIKDPESGDSLQQKRAELTEQLRTNYWQLDPYVRARSVYDRTGMIGKGGQIQYYGTPNGDAGRTAVQAATPSGPLPATHGTDDLD